MNIIFKTIIILFNNIFKELFMKKAFYTIYSILLIALILSAITLLNINKNFNSFSTSNVISHIEELSSNKYKGRLVGTEENLLAAQYIENQFINLKLLPINNSYKDYFKAHAPTKISGDPYFNIYDTSRNLVYKLTYGQDYKETFLNFKNNKFNISKNDKLNIFPDLIEINKDNKRLQLIVNEDNINFRSSFIYDSNLDMQLFISRECYNNLINYLEKNYILQVFIPYKAESINTFNVIGYIEGKDNSLPPLILTSHFDHMGEDLLNNIYPGALDNSSGSAFLIELAKYIKKLPKPNRDIIFISFNGEELGLLGSKHFVENNYNNIKNSTVINFDMIGGDYSIPITFMKGSNNLNRDFSIIQSLEFTAINDSFNYAILSGEYSDHGSFTERGIDAITLCDYDIKRIHTLDDKTEFIDRKSIERAFSIVNKNILNICYGNYKFIYKNTFILSLSLLIILIILSSLYIIRKKFHKKN